VKGIRLSYKSVKCDRVRIARRVVSDQYVGLFERGSNALQTLKRYEEAVRFFSLATEIDPERAGAFYYLAWAYNSKGDKKKSLKALQTAVDKGFTDVTGLESNKAFDSLRNDPQYQKIVSAPERQTVKTVRTPPECSPMSRPEACVPVL
jgi:tetratricopeptide (TPR) repeat protein